MLTVRRRHRRSTWRSPRYDPPRGAETRFETNGVKVDERRTSLEPSGAGTRLTQTLDAKACRLHGQDADPDRPGPRWRRKLTDDLERLQGLLGGLDARVLVLAVCWRCSRRRRPRADARRGRRRPAAGPRLRRPGRRAGGDVDADALREQISARAATPMFVAVVPDAGVALDGSRTRAVGLRRHVRAGRPAAASAPARTCTRASPDATARAARPTTTSRRRSRTSSTAWADRAAGVGRAARTSPAVRAACPGLRRYPAPRRPRRCCSSAGAGGCAPTRRRSRRSRRTSRDDLVALGDDIRALDLDVRDAGRRSSAQGGLRAGGRRLRARRTACSRRRAAPETSRPRRRRWRRAATRWRRPRRAWPD